MLKHMPFTIGAHQHTSNFMHRFTVFIHVPSVNISLCTVLFLCEFVYWNKNMCIKPPCELTHCKNWNWVSLIIFICSFLSHSFCSNIYWEIQSCWFTCKCNLWFSAIGQNSVLMCFPFQLSHPIMLSNSFTYFLFSSVYSLQLHSDCGVWLPSKPRLCTKCWRWVVIYIWKASINHSL